MANFNPALKRVLKYEGGYVNDPDDAGGETYRGIARRFHPNSVMWKEIDKIKKSTTTAKNIAIIVNNNQIVQNEVAKIYKKDYWDALHLDEVKSEKIAYELFDTAVNMGVSKAIKLAQRTIGVPETGRFNFSWFIILKDYV